MTEKPIKTLSGSILAGLSCACPRCGQGKLFQGFLTLRPRCEVCGLDYSFADAGDAAHLLDERKQGSVIRNQESGIRNRLHVSDT